MKGWTRRSLLTQLALAWPASWAWGRSPAPAIEHSPHRARPGHPVELRARHADEIEISAGPGVEPFSPKRFPVRGEQCAFNAPILWAEGSWAPLVCTPLARDARGRLRRGAPVSVQVLALARHFGG